MVFLEGYNYFGIKDLKYNMQNLKEKKVFLDYKTQNIVNYLSVCAKFILFFLIFFKFYSFLY
ncbi:hypothetical protein BBA70_03305 [New Jersey aster yellows phytoplasma]|uniref:Uncharacterized protein n=1 Tax=New Jersey aster yellows phytoplasma TaxID=270520 RepID=A0ABX4K1G8_9MOLU|nr:hypothetical protein BBA70_03305 [New Jersey aster yellows phytoplasma]